MASNSSSYGIGFIVGAAVATALAVPAVAQIAESPSYRLSQTTLGGGGTPAESSSFVLGHTTGQESVVGEAASASFTLQSGFWTSASVNRTLMLVGAGNGDGLLDGDFFACNVIAGGVNGDCSQATVHGTRLSVTAAPDAGSFFTGWAGCDMLLTDDMAGDTCEVVVSRDVTAIAEFVAGGGLSGRIWLDYDGNGLEDSGEPGVPGVEVRLDGGSVATTTTGADGVYTFTGLFPQGYAVTIDPVDLPVGTRPTFDIDGVATPHEASATVPSGQLLSDVDFGVQPLADLEVAMQAEQIGVATVRFTVTVSNLGPADASDVFATIVLQPWGSAHESLGCAEDPLGVPDCSLGDLAAGESAVFALDVVTGGASLVEVVAAVTAEALEADPDGANNSASRGAFVAFPIPMLGLPGLFMLLLLVLVSAGLLFRRKAIFDK